jgi:hypothetical protein
MTKPNAFTEVKKAAPSKRVSAPYVRRVPTLPPGESYLLPPQPNAAAYRENNLWSRGPLSAADLADPMRRSL